MTDFTPTLDFASLQVRDLSAARTFYTEVLGLRVAQETPDAVIFQHTNGASFAIRRPLTDLNAVPTLGAGVALWFSTPSTDDLHARLQAHGETILQAPQPGPFGRMLVARDPDRYALTFHEVTRA